MSIQLDTNSILYQTLHGASKTAAAQTQGSLSVAGADEAQKAAPVQQSEPQTIEEDEFISGESELGGGTGTYSLAQDENGNMKITVDSPVKAQAAVDVQKGTIRQAKGSSITTEDTTSQKSSTAEFLSSLQTAVTSESGATASNLNSNTDSSDSSDDTDDSELETLERKRQQLQQQISAAGDDSDSVAELERSLAEIERQISNLEN